MSLSAPAGTPSELETRLSSYLDGEASEEARHEVEALLVNDPQARALNDALKRGTEVGRRMFDDMLREPVPLDMVRTIKNTAPPRKAVRLPDPPRPAHQWTRRSPVYRPVAMAAHRRQHSAGPPPR